MNLNFILAQIFGTFGIITSALSVQFKKRRSIFLALLFLMIFSILSFVFLGELSGTYISIFAILEMIINYLFEKKNRPIPKSIIIFYVVSNIFIGSLTFKSLIDIFPIIAALFFCFTLLIKDEQNIRKTMFCNQICWLIYDFSVGAYTFGISNILTLISTTIAIYRFNKTTPKKGVIISTKRRKNDRKERIRSKSK